MPYLNRQLYQNFYAGLEIEFEDMRFIFSISELIQIIYDLANEYSQSSNETPDNIKQRIENNIGKKDIVLGGDFLNWLCVAEILKQKETKKKPEEQATYGFMLAGRRLEIYSPSDRYVYDRGSENQYARDQKNPDVEAKKEYLPALFFRNPNIKPIYKEFSGFIATDNLIQDYLGYRKIAEILSKSNCTDFQITRSARQALAGYEPARDETIHDTQQEILQRSAELINTVNNIKSTSSTQQEIDEEKIKRLVSNLFNDPPQLQTRQPTATGQLTETTSALSALIATWFIAELSRNRSAFTVGKMLLDLLDDEIRLECDGMLVNWRNVLCHPELKLEGSLNEIDPERTFCKIGGLYPMAHMGSYDEFKQGGPYYLDPQNLNWAHIKSGVIICEWLKRCLLKNKIPCKILNQEQYKIAINEIPLLDNKPLPKLSLFFKEEINLNRQEIMKRYIYSESPQERKKYFKMFEEGQNSLFILKNHSILYRSAQDRLKIVIFKLFDLLHDKTHEMIMPSTKKWNPTNLEISVSLGNKKVKVTVPDAALIQEEEENKNDNSL